MCAGEKGLQKKKIDWKFDDSSQPQVQPLITWVDSKFDLSRPGSFA